MARILEAFKQCFGHSSITTTQIYTHVTNKQFKKKFIKRFMREEAKRNKIIDGNYFLQ